MNNITHGVEQSVNKVLDNAFALAVAVFQDRIASLSNDDKRDVMSLIPELLNGETEEDRFSAAKAINEILHQPKATLIRLESIDGCDEDLEKWTSYISAKIKEAREKANLTQQQLSEKSGLPQPHISRLEQGKHSPTAITLEKIAVALGLPSNHFTLQ